MRRTLGFYLPVLMALACSGENVVAGDGNTDAEKLAASVTAWCDRICSELLVCEVDEGCVCVDDLCECSAGLDPNCPQMCREEMQRFTGGSDECAAAGRRFQSCVDEAQCDVLSRSQPCAYTYEEEQACPRPSQGIAPDPTTSPNYPIAIDSATSTAGSASYGGTSAEGGTSWGGTSAEGGVSAGGASAGPPVSCQDHYAAGGGVGSAQPHVICEEGLGACSDGHDYQLICVRTTQGTAACSCLVDDMVTGGFDPGETCPSPDAMNDGCGWNIEASEI